MELKVCFKCKVRMPIDNFYRHPGMKDGHLSKCKECARGDVISNRLSKLAYYRSYDIIRAKQPHRVSLVREITRRSRAKNPRYHAVHSAVKRAIASGRLIRLPCEVCGRVKDVQAHHPDYSKPLEVMFLCPPHHNQWHKENKVANST